MRRVDLAAGLVAGVPVDSAIELTADIRAISGAELVILAVPSFAVRETARTAAPFLSAGAIAANVGKGLEKGSKKRLSQVIGEEIPGHPILALSGPSHAEEIARGVPTTIVSASCDRKSAEWVQEVLMNPTLRIYVSDDVAGVELSGALKNIIAVCAGICDGLQLGDNTRAALITRGLAEIARLGTALGAEAATFSGLAGVGDLIVTCTSMHSRNHRGRSGAAHRHDGRRLHCRPDGVGIGAGNRRFHADYRAALSCAGREIPAGRACRPDGASGTSRKRAGLASGAVTICTKENTVPKGRCF